MQVKKFKVIDGALEVTYQERKADGTTKTVTEKHETKAHPDLLQAVNNLRVHYGLLTGFLTYKQVKNISTPDEDLISSFHVSGYSYKTGDDEGLVITGHYIHPVTAKAVIVNTPFTRFNEGDETAYKFIDDLIEKQERAQIEVNAYLDGSKKADDPQQAFDFEGSNSGTTNTDTETLDEDKVWANDERPSAGLTAVN